MDEDFIESDSDSLPPTLDEEEMTDSSSDDDPNEPLSNFLTWVKHDITQEVPGVQESFTILIPPRNNDPLSILNLFISDSLVDLIVQQSNLYATFMDMHISRPMAVNDFWQFLGVLIYMACVDLPGIEYYWKQGTRQQLVADSITRDRFRELLRVLHFNDASLEAAKDSQFYDKIYKVRRLIEAANEAFSNVVEPEGMQSIDEQMVLFTGKTAPAGLQQYMPMKPISHGFKLWARCGVSGYTYEVELYTGRSLNPNIIRTSFGSITFESSDMSDVARNSSISISEVGASSSTRSKRQTYSTYSAESSTTSTIIPITAKVGVGAQVVLRLTENVSPNTRIFFDNFFASFDLLKILSERHLWAVCTMRDKMTKRCPLMSRKLIEKQPRGTYDYRLHQQDNILICAWRDNKRVLLGSNYIGIEPVGTAERYDKSQGGRVEITRPNIVSIYNKHMGGVDLADMLVSMNPINIKSRKWYRRLVWRIFDLLIANSWIVNRQIFEGEKMSLFDLKFYIAKALLSGAIPNPPIVAPIWDQPNFDNPDPNSPANKKKRVYIGSVPDEARLDKSNHFPIFIEKRERCRRSIVGTQRVTACNQLSQWQCSKCRVHLSLSSDRNCFLLFHTQ